ncbi:MAG: BMP family protein [Clostridia bacterium]
MKKTKLVALCLVVVMLASMFVGCAAKAVETPAETPATTEAAVTPAPEPEKKFKVGLCLVGIAMDGGWNQGAYEGLKLLESQYGCEIAYTDNLTSADTENAIRVYAQKGFDLVLGHGYEFGEPLARVAKDFPNVKFGQTGGDSGTAGLPNLSSAGNRGTELGYLMGKAAGMSTKTKKLGFVTTFEQPTTVEEVDAFKASALKIDPAIKTEVVYTGSWTDVAKAKEAAKILLDRGCDVILGIADRCDLGIIQAIQEKNNGSQYIGWVADYNKVAPELVIISAIQKTSSLIELLYKQASSPNYVAGNSYYGIAEGANQIGTWGSFVDPAIKEAVMADYEKIKSGEYTRDSLRALLGMK